MKFRHNIENEEQVRASRGTFKYAAGTSGTRAITGRVYSWSARATVAATVTIDSGDTITIPAGAAISGDAQGALVNPSFVFTGTDAYLIEFLV